MSEINQKDKIAEIVKKYQGSRSLRDFANDLTDGVRGLDVSGQAIHYWVHGVYKPSLNNLMALITQTRDWRREFAMEILREINPDLSKTILFLTKK